MEGKRVELPMVHTPSIMAENPSAVHIEPLQHEFRLAFDSLTRRFSKIELPAPLSVCYAITNRCDKTCDHCMSDSDARSAVGLPTAEVKQVFDKLKAAGVLRVDIVGGEPFLRKDLIDLLRYATQDVGLEAVVTTHGGLVKQEHAEALAGLNMVVQVSVDGLEDMNDRLRGKGSFAGALSAIEKLVKAKVPVRVSTTIQRDNMDSLEDIVRLTKGLGVQNIYVNIVCAQGRASERRDQICLSPLQQAAVEKKLEEIRSKDPEYRDFVEMKRATRAGVFIDTHGNFVSQGFTEEDCSVLGNIFSEDIRAMWKRTKVDHAVHLMQYLQHPLMYK